MLGAFPNDSVRRPAIHQGPYRTLDNGFSEWHSSDIGALFFLYIAYDGDDSDTDVDLVIVLVPRDFGDRCGPNGTVFYNPGLTVDGVGIEAVITTDLRSSMPWVAGVLAHEYGHVVGLPELFDRSHLDIPPGHRISHPDHSAGIGLWGVMAGGEGWSHVVNRSSGPNPMSVWSRMQVGWLTPVTVTADMLDVRIHDVNKGGRS